MSTEESLAALPSDDLLQLDHLTQESLVTSLGDRLENEHRFYTNAGTILVAINPYEWRPELYSANVMAKYRNPTGYDAPLPPHLYQTAQMVDSALQASEAGVQQSIIISGESGAGKTESLKIILSYLVGSSSDSSDSVSSGPSLKDRVLRANPLLEAFGNAQTTRNNNSSRFGKLVELYFRKSRGNGSGTTKEVAGARIVNYLLEKTRLSAAPNGERNFHVLYQLVAPDDAQAPEGTCQGERPAEVRASLPLGQPELLEYLHQSKPWSKPEAEAEARALSRTAASLDALGVDLAARGELWTLLAAVLLLGNLEFSVTCDGPPPPADDENAGGNAVNGAEAAAQGGSVPSDSSVPPMIAKLLGVSPSALVASLCTRKLAIRNQSLIHKQQSPAQARETRDALGRALYNGVFEWLVQRANKTIQPERHATSNADAPEPIISAPLSSVGVLDIYGFECLEHNSFEQLLINLANEKLQRVRPQLLYHVLCPFSVQWSAGASRTPARQARSV